MPGPEFIPIAFEGSQALAFLDEVEGRLARIGSSKIGVGGPGGGGAGGAGGGGGDGGGGGGLTASAIATLVQSLQSGFASQSPYAANSGALYGTTLGGFEAAKAGVQGGVDFIGNLPVVGPALKPLAEVGAGALKAGINAKERDVFEPTENAIGRIGGIGGQLARAGVSVSDKDLELSYSLALEQERRAYDFKKRLYQYGFSNGQMMDALTHAFNH